MRQFLVLGALVSTVASLSFLEKAQGYLSGGASVNASVSAGTSDSSGSNFLSGLQNSSFGQAVAEGIDLYNNVKSGNTTDQWQTALANSSLGGYYQTGVEYYNTIKNGNSSGVNTDSIQKSIANSTFGEVVQSGVDFFNSMKNGNSKYSGNASEIISAFLPFLTNASTEAQTEFYAILPNVANLTIAEFENQVNAWAVKYNLTADVEAYNQRAENMTIAAEEHANAIVMNLPNVLSNLKAIGSDKNQTVEEMHSRIVNYIVSLDDDTRDIVIVLFNSLLPPQFKQVKCSGGSFITDMWQKATDFFGGNGSSTSGSSSSSGSFWSGGNNGAVNTKIGILTNFFNKNNLTDADVNVALSDPAVQLGDTASVQILPVAHVKLQGDVETSVTKKNKKQQQQANKNKKKATTVAPAGDANLAVEVHAQVL
ncbi:unnamed protein product [Caenorhabditis sp. 36 PRJEB53466]|nr:unnamed protein product [Caenorhabditis sp. 36 PRJEB53466]